MEKTPAIQDNNRDLAAVYEYHDRTKHHLHRYAHSLGYLDWKSQPNPFRRYDQSARLPLAHTPPTDAPTYDSLFAARREPPAPVDRDSISRLFYESLAISAWKQAGGTRWSLRVNPSSGDLHPTEAYLVAGPIKDTSTEAAVYHYSAYDHALERRVILAAREWDDIRKQLPENSLLVALASIYWRESWKYGERAFRYCHHDAGHAIGALTFAAAALGWKTRLIPSVTDGELATLLGLDRQEGVEAEHPDCLLAIWPAGEQATPAEPDVHLSPAMLARLEKTEFEGQPNTLSGHHHEWPIIDAVARACRYDDDNRPDRHSRHAEVLTSRQEFPEDRQVSARRIIRERRSALAMDGRTAISRDAFYRMMAHASPHTGRNITAVLPWRACVSLAVFIHRVEGLAAGLYLLARDSSHLPSLKKALRPEFRWTRPEGCPEFLHLYLLQEGDALDAARIISCHQDIAADGAFALGMLAEFDAGLNRYGAPFYPRLYWETGLIGQILYLEAEAAGIRSTGIGCFFDDAMHELLGITDHSWQSLYHFTVGGPVDDPRLQTLPSYWYLK